LVDSCTSCQLLGNCFGMIPRGISCLWIEVDFGIVLLSFLKGCDRFVNLALLRQASSLVDSCTICQLLGNCFGMIPRGISCPWIEVDFRIVLLSFLKGCDRFVHLPFTSLFPSLVDSCTSCQLLGNCFGIIPGGISCPWIEVDFRIVLLSFLKGCDRFVNLTSLRQLASVVDSCTSYQLLGNSFGIIPGGISCPWIEVDFRI